MYKLIDISKYTAANEKKYALCKVVPLPKTIGDVYCACDEAFGRAYFLYSDYTLTSCADTIGLISAIKTWHFREAVSRRDMSISKQEKGRHEKELKRIGDMDNYYILRKIVQKGGFNKPEEIYEILSSEN